MKAVVYLIGSLLVGGLGNGVWEYILEPTLSEGTSLILSIATLGAQTIKDDIYVDISRGFHEKYSVDAANSISQIAAYAIMIAFFALSQVTKTLVEKTNKSGREIEMLEAELGSVEVIVKKNLAVEDERNSFCNRLTSLKEGNLAQKNIAFRNHRLALIFLSFSFAIFSWIIVDNVKSQYINSAIAHFEQSLTIVSPYATPDEVVAIRSRFAQVNKRDDFVEVLKEVKHMAARGGLQLRSFDAW